MKALVKRILEITPYRVTRRTSLNRFQAIDQSLLALCRRGYMPRRIIDGGANCGDFTRYMLKLFPEAIVHAIEPQPGCQPDLRRIKAKNPNRFFVHAVALCAPENDGGTLLFATDQTERSTGAHVTSAPAGTDARSLAIPCATLDRLLAAYRQTEDHTLIKLDLQGYEHYALRGAIATLATADVVLSEVSFFVQAYEPAITEIVDFLSKEGFDLYDVVSLYSRPRDDRPRQADFLFVKRTSALAADKLWD